MMTSPATDAWMASGKLENAKEDVIVVLQERFSDEAIPSTIKTKIDQTNDLLLIKVWHRKAITVPSVTDFENLMSATIGPSSASLTQTSAKTKSQGAKKNAK